MKRAASLSTPEEPTLPRWRRYLWAAIAAAVSVWLLSSLYSLSRDPIDRARTCSDLEVAIDEAVAEAYDSGTWGFLGARMEDRYDELSCTFNKNIPWIMDTEL